MNIAFIGQKGIPVRFGGVERAVDELAQRLVARGNDVTVYTRPHYTPARLRKFRGVRLVSLPSIATKHFDAISHTFLATVHAMFHDVDLIHYHGVGPSLLSFLPRIFRPSVRVVATIHCLDREHAKWGAVARFFLRLGEWTALTFPHATITVAKTIAAYCRTRYGKTATVIPNGSGPRAKRGSGRSVLRRLRLAPRGYLLAVARFVPHKELHTLIRAFRGLATAHQLVIVGGPTHTENYERRLHALADGDPRIRFLGFQRDAVLGPLFRNAALSVHPSASEGLPITLLEAARAGLCIVASDIPEHKEILQRPDGALGIFFRTGNVLGLRRALRTALRKPATARGMGHAAGAYVRTAYNWETIAKDTERFYRSLLATVARPSVRTLAPQTQ